MRRPEPIRLAFQNGWTLSIARDLSGHGYSIVAWPTDDPKTEPANKRRWFEFSAGVCELRVFAGEPALAAVSQIAAAAPPKMVRQ